MIGVDLSSYQSGLQSASPLISAGVKFAILKLTEGKTYRNPSAGQHYAMLKGTGIKIGAYALTHAETPIVAEQEAEAALEYLGGRPLELPIFFDIEPAMWALGKTVLMPCAMAFCRRIKAAGYRAGVYASLSAWQTVLDANQLRAEGFLIWCAAYNNTGPGMTCDIWQCSDSWTIPGYLGKLDKDILYIEDEDDDKSVSGLITDDENEDVPVTPRLYKADMATMCRGFYGTQVTMLQKFLFAAGYLSFDHISGVYDYYTEQAVKGYQEENDLAPDGMSGPKTYNA